MYGSCVSRSIGCTDHPTRAIDDESIQQARSFTRRTCAARSAGAKSSRQVRSSSFTASHSQGEKPQGRSSMSIWSRDRAGRQVTQTPQRDRLEHGRSRQTHRGSVNAEGAENLKRGARPAKAQDACDSATPVTTLKGYGEFARRVIARSGRLRVVRHSPLRA